LTGDTGASGYGFGILCGDDACDEVFVAVTAGRNERDLEGSTGPVDRLVKPYAQNYDALQADELGRMRLRWMDVQSQEAVFPVLPPSTGDAPDRSVTTADVAGAWSFPVTPATATGVSLVALLGAALYYFWPALKGAAFAPLFSRIEDDEILKHPNRARINELIRAEPGIHFQDLARRVGLGRGTLDHHLRKLVDAELVTIRRSGGYACCFPKGSGAIDRRLMDAAPVLRSQGGRAVLQVVARRPGTSNRDLAMELGLAPSTVSYHLKKLELAGLVLPDPAAGVRLTPLGEQAKA
jgi:predicted transcriptional regulator